MSSEIDGYRRVADVIGEEMDQTWRRILERLASGKTSDFASEEAKSISQQDLSAFFSVLGGANLGVNFMCIEPIGSVGRTYGHMIGVPANLVADAPSKLLGGSISIGVSVNF